MLLLVSGGIRFGRDWKFSSLFAESKDCPFRLSELPTVLGTWRATDNSEKQLEPEIARIAGSSDSLVRNYQDSKTGESASVLVLYGPANLVFGHTPIVCYPAAGYQAVQPTPPDGTFKISEIPTPVQFSTAYYARNAGGISEYTEAVWTFRHDGIWKPEMKDRWKSFRYKPGMFKVQIHRVAMSIGTEDGPTQSLLKEIVREIESRLAATEAAKAADGQASTRTVSASK